MGVKYMNLNIDFNAALSIVSLIFSAINIIITLINWYNHRTRLSINILKFRYSQTHITYSKNPINYLKNIEVT